MRKRITLKSYYDFPDIVVTGTFNGSYWEISRRTYRRIPRDRGYRMLALTPDGYRDPLNPLSPVLVAV